MNLAALAKENAALKALLAQTQTALSEHQAALAASEEARRRLESILSELQREKFGSKSEKLSPDCKFARNSDPLRGGFRVQ